MQYTYWALFGQNGGGTEQGIDDLENAGPRVRTCVVGSFSVAVELYSTTLTESGGLLSRFLAMFWDSLPRPSQVRIIEGEDAAVLGRFPRLDFPLGPVPGRLVGEAVGIV